VIAPSDIAPRGGIFLPGAFGKAELEQAALCVLLVCQKRGAWGLVAWSDVKALIKAGDNPLADFARNPFFRPDFHGLEQKGLARWDCDRLALTEQAIARMHEIAPARESTSL